MKAQDPSRRPLPGLLPQTLAVLRKDLLLEWRGRSRFLSVFLFGAVTVLLFSFAMPNFEVLKQAAAGCLILGLLLSSTLGLAESFRHEQSDSALEGLILLPIDPVALYYGKAVGNTLFLFALAPVLIPFAVALYQVDLGGAGVLKLVGLWMVTAAGLSAPGTLYSGMTSRLRSQDVLLPLLLFPLVIPVLLAAAKSASLIVLGDPMSELSAWLLFLLAFDLIYWSLCGILFPMLSQEAL